MAHGSTPSLIAEDGNIPIVRHRNEAFEVLGNTIEDNEKKANLAAASHFMAKCVHGNVDKFDIETMKDSSGERYIEGYFYHGETFIVVRLAPGNRQTKYPLLFLKDGDEDIFAMLLKTFDDEGIKVRIGGMCGFKRDELKERSQRHL